MKYFSVIQARPAGFIFLILFFVLFGVGISCRSDRPLATYQGGKIMESDLISIAEMYLGDYSLLQKEQKKIILRDMALIRILSELGKNDTEITSSGTILEERVSADFFLSRWRKNSEKVREPFVPIFHILITTGKESPEKAREDADIIFQDLKAGKIRWEDAAKKSMDKNTSGKNGDLGFVAENTRFPAETFPQFALIIRKEGNPEKYGSYSYCRVREIITLEEKKIPAGFLSLCKKQKDGSKEILMEYSPGKTATVRPQDVEITDPIRKDGQAIFPPVYSIYGWHIIKTGSTLKMDKKEYRKHLEESSPPEQKAGVEATAGFIWDKILNKRIQDFIDNEYQLHNIPRDFALPCDWKSGKGIIQTEKIRIDQDEFQHFLEWYRIRYNTGTAMDCDLERKIFARYLQNRILSQTAQKSGIHADVQFQKRMEWEKMSEIAHAYMEKQWGSGIKVDSGQLEREYKQIVSREKKSGVRKEEVHRYLYAREKRAKMDKMKNEILNKYSFKITME